jgi:hypothetical protein
MTTTIPAANGPVSPTSDAERLELARWQEDLLERRASQYDTGVSAVLVVAALIAASSAASWSQSGGTEGWPLAAAAAFAVLGAMFLMVPSLVRTKNDESRIVLTDSANSSAPTAELITLVSARTSALSDYLARRRILIYVGYGLTLLAGGALFLYVVVAGIFPAMFPA